MYLQSYNLSPGGRHLVGHLYPGSPWSPCDVLRRDEFEWLWEGDCFVPVADAASRPYAVYNLDYNASWLKVTMVEHDEVECEQWGHLVAWVDLKHGFGPWMPQVAVWRHFRKFCSEKDMICWSIVIGISCKGAFPTAGAVGCSDSKVLKSWKTEISYIGPLLDWKIGW